MALSRHPHITDGRDERADYIAAYLREYHSYKDAGLTERANQVVVELRALGHEIDKAPTGGKERAVADPSLETAVDDAPAPKRGRPKKAAG
ncbi:hypothetical protein JRC04_04870 [Mycolicibacterium sp. S2-37]|uniref:hypothetical protein n=1 Tax=Mycolicibacterium sp. S2-37 TaxID=2810297 RepID=UPI001A946F06|nr:hypothetical protein [Mycolicibacterium sp. S2-37]MBO0676792.1 hypothetical protein [Mycolicibacterium sp. S2-37]